MSLQSRWINLNIECSSLIVTSMVAVYIDVVVLHGCAQVTFTTVMPMKEEKHQPGKRNLSYFFYIVEMWTDII